MVTDVGDDLGGFIIRAFVVDDMFAPFFLDADEAEEDGSRVVSPDSVIPESTSRSSQVRVTCPGVNLATELDGDVGISNGDMSSY